MHLAVEHRTTYRYEPEAASLALRLKIFPAPTPAQRIRSWRVTVNGEPVAPLLTDGFGDAEGLWFSRRQTETVEVVAEGTVETSDRAGVLGKIGVGRPAVFLRDTDLTAPCEALATLAKKAEGQATDPLARLHALSESIHAEIAYRPKVTDAGTTAAQALALEAGTCQDFTQIFIAAARIIGIPSRYVVGYLHDPDAPEMESHAWAEAHLPSLGWVGFDPTHKICPTDAYIRLCSGLDAADAAPLRGSLVAGSKEKLDVTVSVAPVPAGQSQTQQQ
ncbi:MAG: transglutaminase family protein [Pseudomonadota bacterium]